MAIIGVFTNVGVSKAIEAQNSEGFKIYPTSFGVSSTKTIPLDPSITNPNAGQWYQGVISSRTVVDAFTVKFVCTIPPGVIPSGTQIVSEVYLNGTDNTLATFMFAAGQPSTDIIYDPSGSVTLELEVSITNASIVDKVIFSYTQAQELAEHNLDPNAHPDHIRAMNLAGMFLPAGGAPFYYAGQPYDQQSEFAGAVAQIVYSGVTFSSIHNGVANNTKTLIFNGAVTVGQVVVAFNAANPGNEITHTGLGSVVLPAGTATITGGTLLVADGDVVYRDTDGYYKKALSDSTIKSRVAGIAEITDANNPKRVVRASGFIRKITGFTIGTDIYLSEVTAGAITTTITAIKLGHVVGTGHVLIGTGGGGGAGGGSSEFDAVVTNTAGFGNYTTTQAAINVVSDGGSILIAKQEALTTMINTLGKRLKFTFSGITDGWLRYTGNAEQQKITFASVPTIGTWRAYWNGQQTADMAYNANAATVQAELNALTGTGLPVTVTGNYTIGFTIVYTTFIDVPEPTFTDPGTDEVQRITFSSIPDDGTFRLDFAGQQTVNVAWNDDATYVETALEALSNITDVDVTGNFSSGFTVTFTGVDGKQNKAQMTIANNSLSLLGSPTTPAVTTLTQGQSPANSLKNGITPVALTVQTLLGGTPIGPGTAIQVTANNTTFVGYGRIENFINGIDLNGFTGSVIQAHFIWTQNPVIGNTLLEPGVDYRLEESTGINRQVVRTAGLTGDYSTLDAAYSVANDGDKIIVMEDQSILVAKTYTKKVTIEFINEAKLNVDAVIAGDIVTLGSDTKTINMRMLVANAGTYGSAYALSGNRGHHTNLGLELSGAGVIFTTGFTIAAGSNVIYCDGYIQINSATVTTVLLNSSGFVSHNVIIRDKDNGIIHDLINREPPIHEVPTGTVDGVNLVFTLSNYPVTPQGVLVLIDGIPTRPSPTAWVISGNVITFISGYQPQIGQQIEAYYWTTALTATPASGRAAPFDVYSDGSFFESGVTRIDFTSNLNVANGGPGQVIVSATGGDFANVDIDIQPDTDAAWSLGTETKSWKDIFLKDKTTGDKYRLEIDNGVLQAVLLP